MFCILACLSFLFGGCDAASHSPRSGTSYASPTATLALLGDIQLGRGVAQAHLDGGWEHILRFLKRPLSRSSLAVGNLESPLSTAEIPDSTSGYNLCAPSEGVLALTAAGIDLLSLANNHLDDCQPGGLDQTRQILENAGLAGILPASAPAIKDVNGLQLAFLAFDDVSQPLDEPSAMEAVGQASLSADIVIVSMHWGAEYHAAPTDRQKTLARDFADAGADLIWGHHPHVLQPLEYLPRPNGQSPALVAYSLGNALFDQRGSPQANRSALLLLEIGSQGVQSFEIMPFEIDPLSGVVKSASQESAQRITHVLEAWLDKEQ